MLSGTGSRTALIAIALFSAACSKNEQKDQMAMASATPAEQGAAADGRAEYTVVFKSTWTKQNHPLEYPEVGALTRPHFSGVIGASHDESYQLFAEGSKPSAGIERLSEEGKHSPLDGEIRGAVTGGDAAELFESGPLRDFTDSVVTTVRVDAAHPLVSLVAMIAPSPDWFAGASNVDLREGNSWVASRTIQLNAWDSGGDDGATYKAADKDNNPKKPTMRATSRHFVKDGVAVPVATVSFIRK